MKNTLSRLIGAACLLAGAASLPAAATPVTSLVGATQLAMPVKNIFGTGPFSFAPGITWSSNSGDAVFGSTDGYGFDANGDWDYRKTLVATNDSTSSMTFTFDITVSGFGGFLNWAPGSGNASIAVYDVNHVLIESVVLGFLTDGSLNSGEFHGFQESGTSIKYFTLTGAYIGGADFAVKAVPEPASMALSLLGLGLLGAMSRRKPKQG
ncbi:PEP-CTERM sorting domain-containing protein [Rhodoferax sp.]|uniref:PEP-CTERM sorting domain-containing protein n=1 Tax=Rhodoferax sp. TaxID=50421 RepID=UPI0025F8121D|nr:PEP-CTERM sorting domain-containing protein [Rhodoferax sp.]